MLSNLSKGRLPVAGTAVAAVLVLAACSSNSAPAASGRATPSTMASTSASAAANPAAAVHVPQYVAAENARKSVVTGACTLDGKKGWRYAGHVTNTTKTAHRYSIVVDFVTTKGDTVMDTKVVRTGTVAAGATAAWQATGAIGDSNINCVVREALDRS
jgi:hypothetical protein